MGDEFPNGDIVSDVLLWTIGAIHFSHDIRKKP